MREARRKREDSRDRKQERNWKDRNIDTERNREKIHPKTKLEPHIERNTDRDRETHRHAHTDMGSGWWEAAGNGVYCLLRASPFPFSLQTGTLRPRKGIRLAPVDTVYRHYDRI